MAYVELVYEGIDAGFVAGQILWTRRRPRDQILDGLHGECSADAVSRSINALKRCM